MKKWIVISSFIIISLALSLVTGQPAQAAHRLQTGTLSVSPAAAAQSGPVGNLVQYSLTVTNSGAGQTQINSSISGNAWQTSASPNQLTLAAGEQGTVTVSVAIPANSSPGSTDTATVTFVSSLDSSTASAILTTTATNPTATPPPGVQRPLVVIESYTAGGAINPGREFDLSIKLSNLGQRTATNMVISFGGTDFLPRTTGGVRAVANLDAGMKVDVTQPMFAPLALWGFSYGTVPVTITYNDGFGGSYTESFTLTLNLVVPAWGGTATPTPTPTQLARPQLVVSGYRTDVDPLQPGSIFELALEVRNLGAADARSITMVVGGTASVDASGTAVPGGISGGGSDVTNFAPLGSSNLVFLGDVAAGSLIQASQKLIVNVSANPGAYPLKLSFVYTSPTGQRMIDDQVITLLVYSLPQLEVNFYQDPGMFMVGQTTMLPLQVNNLGRKTAVLGTFKVTAENADLMNNSILIGTLEPGGYYTLDTMLTPMMPGELQLTFTISYTDDFNQPRQVEQTMLIQVEDMPVFETPEPGTEGNGGEPILPEPETFWQKVLRFFRGLFGLGSAQETPTPMPGEFEPLPGESEPIIIPGGKG